MFLQSVAKYFAEGVESRPKVSTITFVLPNKRSVLFLKKFIRECMTKVSLMPRIMTEQTFVSILANAPEAPHRQLLFVLYDAYREVMRRKGREDSLRQFDNFIFWGEMMMADFDDIDKSLVNADDIFRNLKNVKEIQADYLDEDQKEVIRRIWGDSRLTANIDEFWLHLGNGSKPSDLKTKFIFLWEILAEIYHEYHKRLKERHLSSDGSRYRRAVEAIKNFDLFDFTGDTRYAFVGFNDFSVATTLIADRLKRNGVAYFFWDTAPMQLVGQEGIRESRALRRLAHLKEHFPMPEDYEVPGAFPPALVNVTAVPSNVAQTKAAGKVLSEWLKEGYIDTSNPMNTAVILPDQGLLLPMLMAIPDGIDRLNISMGINYRTTTFASLLHAIISMQLRAREIHGEYHFFHEDIVAVTNHPHIRIIAPEAADAILNYISSQKVFNLPTSIIQEKAPKLMPVFESVKNLNNVQEVGAYLTTLLDWLTEELTNAAPSPTGAGFELEALKFFRTEVDALSALVCEYGVSMSERTFLQLFERVFNSRALSLSGTPLAGLQVLGVLETRTLDFDNVIILSMNERIYPKKQYTKTMIPNNLRSGYGLPDFENQEWTYAYCFYRLLSRAKRVTLFYDSRSEALGGGEMSRYLAQMKYLMPTLKCDFKTLSVGATPGERTVISIHKDEEVMKRLAEFYPGGSLRLSVAALKTYKKCPLEFYLSYVRRMRSRDELVDYMTAADYGTIVHAVIQSFYAGYENCLIDRATIESWINTPNLVEEHTLKILKSKRFPHLKDDALDRMTTEAKLAVDLIAIIVRSNLEAEIEMYCTPDFTFLKNEKEIEGNWKIDDDLTVRFYMSIDRVDSTDAKHLRFIDFKTGADKTASEDIESLFDSESNGKDAIFQLFTYCEAYLALVDRDVSIMPIVHPLRQLSARLPLKPISINRKKILDYKEVAEEFRPHLKELIKQIFDPEVDFHQCDDIDHCDFCAFKSMCGRIKADTY